MLQSSTATGLMVSGFAAGGLVDLVPALAVMLGANVGTTLIVQLLSFDLSPVTPALILIGVLMTSEGKDATARRVPAGNLGTRAVGVALGLAMLPKLGAWLVTVVPDPARAVADFHLGFNLVVAALFFPVLPSYAKLLRRLFPTRVDAPDPSRPVYLDEAAREAPVVAIGAAAREALRLADMLEAMLLAARDAFATDERKRVAEVRRMDDVLDRLNHAIKTYLTGLDAESTSDADQRRIEQILAFTINLEHAGDVVDKNPLDHAAKLLKRNIILSQEQREELAATISRLVTNLRAAASVFMTEDVRAARALAAEKEAFRNLEAAETEAHFAQIRAGQAQAAERSAWRLDLLRDLKRVNDHLVASAAYPVLKDQGELLPTRLRENE